MKSKWFWCLGIVVVTAFVAGAAIAQPPNTIPFSDNFDGWTADQGLSEQSDEWETWDDNPTADAIVNTDQARSGENSVRTVANEMGFSDSDLILRLDDPFDGCYEVKVFQYIPSDQSGETYWIHQSIYVSGDPDKVWATQVHMNADTRLVTADFDGETADLVTDQWVELKLLVDFPNDLHQIFYNGTPMFSEPKSWIDAMNGGNDPKIASSDWYANQTCCAFYDDYTITKLGDRCPFGGESGCIYTLKKSSKNKKGCTSCPRRGDEYASGDECNDVKDCAKKINIKKIDCPDGGRGFCKKIKGKRSDCI